MRHPGAGRRSRNRGGHGGHNHHRQGGGGNNRAQVFDSNGPEVRIRGTAYQICEKYQALAKDAAASGDRTLSENYLQHAEHYQRIINSWADAQPHRDTQPRHFEQNQPLAEAEDLGLPASLVGAVRTEQQVLENA